MSPVDMLVFISILAYADSLKRPDYIKPCSLTQNYHECAMKHAEEAMPFVVEGDKTFKIPNFHPLILSSVQLKASDTFILDLTDVTVTGLEKMVTKDVNFDTTKKEGFFKVFVEDLQSSGTYTVDGMVSILPIKGSGAFNITFAKVKIDYYFKWKLNERKGKVYADFYDTSVKYDAESVFFNLENLFNGDKTLGNQINTFLNENWREMNKDFEPSIAGAMVSVADQISISYFSKVPYDEMILP